MTDNHQTLDPNSMPAHQQHMQDDEQQTDREVPISTPPDATPLVQFYRTSYKLSEQQLTLPRGLYGLRPGASLEVQLYVAVHPQDWDGDAYVAQRAARLQQLAHPQVGRRAGGALCWAWWQGRSTGLGLQEKTTTCSSWQ